MTTAQRANERLAALRYWRSLREDERDQLGGELSRGLLDLSRWPIRPSETYLDELRAQHRDWVADRAEIGGAA